VFDLVLAFLFLVPAPAYRYITRRRLARADAQ